MLVQRGWVVAGQEPEVSQGLIVEGFSCAEIKFFKLRSILNVSFLCFVEFYFRLNVSNLCNCSVQNLHVQ